MFIARVCEDTQLLIATVNKGGFVEPGENEDLYFVYQGGTTPNLVMTGAQLLDFLSDPETKNAYFGFHA